MDEIKSIRILVNDVFDLKIETRKRQRKYVNARACYYALCKKYISAATLYQIGKEIGLNHATVLHGLNNAEIFKNHDGFKELWERSDTMVESVLGRSNDKELLNNENAIAHFARRYEIAQRKNIILMQRLIAVSDDSLKKSVSELDPGDLNNLIETRIKPYVAMRKKQTA